MAISTKRKVHVDYRSSDSGSDADSEISDNSLDEENDLDDEPQMDSRKSGLADVMSKILNKKVPVHKQVILAKGKTDKELKKRKLEKDEEDEDGEKKTVKVKVEKPEGDIETMEMAREEKRKLWENLCRVKPDPLDRPREKNLQRIATRGVVQLFNAVRKQQKVLEGEMNEVGSSERKKDKVMEGMTKDKFLNILKGASSTNVKMENIEPVTVKKEPVDDTEPQKWGILRDDYMMGAKMKDWNKDSSDEGGDSDPGNPDLSDSD